MRNKPTTNKRRPVKATLAELGEAQERATLRRAREHQRRVTMLSRSLARSVDTSQVWKVRAARTLVDGTDYVVVGCDEVDRLTRRVEELNQRVEQLGAEDRAREVTRAFERA